jgi:type II secretory pathway component GspD/PulD (secretin)
MNRRKRVKMKQFVSKILSIFAAGWVASGTEVTTNALVPRAPPDTTAADATVVVVTDTNLLEKVAPTKGLILNFHDVPLNAVLNYLSARAGLIIVSDVDLKGKVSVVAEQPVTTNEMVDLLSAQLAKNNYAVMLLGRTLTIMDAAGAKTSALTPVIVNNSGPKQIPYNDEIVTEILPVHTLQPTQLVKDLELLIPTGDTVIANDAGQAIIMTASQKDVHRISEIIAALDDTAISDVEVFVLHYADAKSLAAELKEIFQTSDSDIAGANTRNSFGSPDGPGGGLGPPGFPGFPGGGGDSNESTKNAQTHAIFVSDDQLNAIVASVPPNFMHTVSNMIAALDQPSQGVTEIKVFRLKHADPGEIADELSNLFPSSSADSNQNDRSMGFQFSPFEQQPSSNASQTKRMKWQSTVLAVADRRTQSVIVTASKDMMDQIQGVVKDLDQGAQGVQMVTALNFGGADPATVEETMAALFSSANSRNQNATQTATPLANRYTGNANSQSTSAQSATSGGSSGTGSTSAH